MKRALIVIATLFSLTACSGQQVQDVAGWTAGAAIITTATALAVYGIKNDLEEDCDARCRADKQRAAALRESAEERRTAHRIAELSASLDAYLTAEPNTETEQRSVVFVPEVPAVPQQSFDRLDAVLPEEAPEN